MKTKTLSAFAVFAGALILNSSAEAAPHFVLVSYNSTDPFLVANNLHSAVIGITGFAPGENLQGFIGTSASPWTIKVINGGTFFNIDSNDPYFDGQGQTAATALNAPPNGQWDTGVIANPTTNALGAIISGGFSNPVGFAQFGVGQNSGPGNDVFWLSLSAQGVPITGTANLFRFTWSNTSMATIGGLLITNTGGGQGHEYSLSFDFPIPPSPGVMGLFAIAGLTSKRRRRT